ncbi:glycosyltransferase [Microbacterium amylolyticum]|uniref:Galactofuranosylgalactofuranosylrhamnosyl-N-acetylglucosaminyl-diphospho-decaprenol beta-1,5/1,6-galactofuranosyltransferase n=1 Tax=Microbacterium amylolyticum TaxID=936337 RepID=A0ABS4ZJW3_9MICO|nr:glycosyltransferase [Microbacterium amylolyticum]MBP2437577.1 galactofuranosylgalactofuranosylrhamnosyl-N-acetylglucosaminyl-diphospho-decaprenol beta-1,5/1,6-galactofuranosyltransferase [Microbacterium amylolyticum]
MSFVLQNVVFPTDRDPDLLPLYLDADTWSVIDEKPVRVTNSAHIGDVLDRTRLRVAAGNRTSLASYFNGFPASYWQHWTSVRQVRLTVRTEGAATILVYRSNGSAVQQRIDTAEVAGEATSTFDIPLTQFSDGGWIWFDIVADREDVVLAGAQWTTDHEPARSGKASLGITTYNKPTYCVETLEALAASPDVLDVVDRIFLVDQGTDRVDGQSAYPAVAEALGEQLQVITQANLGGSGGFARAMSETMKRSESDFVQLLDDDVRIEPESIRRAVTFGRFATTPVLVGAHMFDLLDRPRLHAWAEVIDEHPFMWRNLFQEQMPHDFREANLRQSPLLHMRMDADYNGWWMCLIPKAAIEKVGLAMPGFIKWDDAEYCLRARSAGIPTVSLPGAALWHVSWVGKDDSIDWQAYFHARNRIVAGLVHSSAPEGGTLIRHSRRVDLKHLMMMQYYPVALRNRALRDVLSGPAHMREALAKRMPEARELAKTFPETIVHRDPEQVLHSRKGRQVFARRRRHEFDSPEGIRLRWFTAKTLLTHWLKKPATENVATPEVEFGKDDAHWWRLPAFDSAIVSAADGSGKQIYTRDRGKFRGMLLESIRLHRRLQREWPRLQREYRAAFDQLVSEDSWQKSFEANT